MESFWLCSQQSLNTTILHLLSLQEFKQKWNRLACLLPTLVLLAEFNVTMKAAHVLLAKFTRPIITLVN
jgi:hypothetical protein